MRTRILISLTSAGLLALTACSGGDSGADSSGDGELTPVTIGAIPIVDTAASHLGLEQGFFEEEGIDLTIENTDGGAGAMAGVVSGNFEFAFGNLTSVMVAHEEGLPVQYVTNGTSVTGSEDGFGAVVVPEDSDIQSAADLPGNTVSTNNFANITGDTVNYAVEQDGGDPSTIDYIELPFPDMPAAVMNGQVDAAMVVEPFLTQAIDQGARVVSWNFQAIPEMDIAGYFTSTEVLEGDPDLVEQFTRAMNRSLEYAAENPEEVRDVVGTYTEIGEDIRSRMNMPTFRVEFNREAAQTLGQAGTRYGTLSEEPDLDAIFPD
ncbi:MAG TPA: ABC transporter substrate-binding protein [Jiangellaceae bacterium]|nr:ABC transporter substrate-binding protein [Jiangellaceae bacterium]